MSRLSVPDLDILLVLKYWYIGAMHAHCPFCLPGYTAPVRYDPDKKQTLLTIQPAIPSNG